MRVIILMIKNKFCLCITIVLHLQYKSVTNVLQCITFVTRKHYNCVTKILPMNVLSLFDGMSCGQQALERAGIEVDKYFASEIDKYAIQVTMANYPNTIQLGSVVDVDGHSLPKIDLLIGGSPCQSFSFAGKRKGMSTKDEQEILTLEHYLQLKSEGYEFEGQSYLFWEYMRLLNEVKPKYFLLENVMMGEKWEKVLSKAIGVKPIEINSALVSAQNRRRLYWTNIGMRPAGLFGDMESIIEQPKDLGILLKDILQDNPNAKYYLSDKTIATITRHKNKIIDDKENPQRSATIHANYFKMGGRDQQYIIENCESIRIDEKYYLSQDQTDKVLDKTGVDPNVDEPKILDVYNNKIKEDGKSITLTDPCHNNLRLIEPIPVDEKYYLSEKMTQKMVITNESQNIVGHSGTGGQKGIIHNIEGQSSSLCATDYKQPKQINTPRIRRLTPIECERLQTVADNYTNFVSDSQRYKMLGNGWTISVIAHIFSYINK